jgi:hypothetical protein
MSELLKRLFTDGSFMPHGHCYFWKPEIIGLHVTSDALIALAYYSIPLTLVYFTRKRRDVPYPWMFMMFGAFIVACGTTHVLEIWSIWHSTYWLSGLVKAITALLSVATAVLLVKLVPQALLLRGPRNWRGSTSTWSPACASAPTSWRGPMPPSGRKSPNASARRQPDRKARPGRAPCWNQPWTASSAWTIKAASSSSTSQPSAPSATSAPRPWGGRWPS